MLTQTRGAIRSTLAVAAVLALVVAFVLGHETGSGGPSTAVTPGPFHFVDGVTVGFDHTQSGAESAAAHYLLEIERAMDTLSAQRTAEVARVVATGPEARAITAHAASVIALEEAHGAPLRRIAISTDPFAYSPTAAQVTVLESWIYALSSQEAVWAIERVAVVWQGSDWRVSAITGGAPSANEPLVDLRSQLSFPGPGDASIR